MPKSPVQDPASLSSTMSWPPEPSTDEKTIELLDRRSSGFTQSQFLASRIWLELKVFKIAAAPNEPEIVEF